MDNPFDLDNHAPYQRWRDTKRASHPGRAEDLIVDVADPRALSQTERDRLLALCATANMAIYRSPVVAQDKAIPRLLAAQMGLHRLDGNWLADEDGISPITVSQALPPTALRTGPPGGNFRLGAARHRSALATAPRSSPTPTEPSNGIPTATTTQNRAKSGPWFYTACARPKPVARARSWTMRWPTSPCVKPTPTGCAH